MPPDQRERALDLVDKRLDFGSHLSSPAMEKARTHIRAFPVI
jgi:hypothetical protein